MQVLKTPESFLLAAVEGSVFSRPCNFTGFLIHSKRENYIPLFSAFRCTVFSSVQHVLLSQIFSYILAYWPLLDKQFVEGQHAGDSGQRHSDIISKTWSWGSFCSISSPANWEIG